MTKHEQHSPQQLRSLSAFHHRRFNSAHEGLKVVCLTPFNVVPCTNNQSKNSDLLLMFRMLPGLHRQISKESMTGSQDSLEQIHHQSVQVNTQALEGIKSIIFQIDH